MTNPGLNPGCATTTWMAVSRTLTLSGQHGTVIPTLSVVGGLNADTPSTVNRHYIPLFFIKCSSKPELFRYSSPKAGKAISYVWILNPNESLAAHLLPPPPYSQPTPKHTSAKHQFGKWRSLGQQQGLDLTPIPSSRTTVSYVKLTVSGKVPCTQGSLTQVSV